MATKADTSISWELGKRHFDNQQARDFLADRYERHGEMALAGCIRRGMPVDHISHVALLILTEFIKSQAKPVPWRKYKQRICLSLHHCEICNQAIVQGEAYFDGGYGRRAHEDCVVRTEAEAKHAD